MVCEGGMDPAGFDVEVPQGRLFSLAEDAILLYHEESR